MKAGGVRVHTERKGVITLVRQQDAPEARHGHVSNKFPFCLSHLGYSCLCVLQQTHPGSQDMKLPKSLGQHEDSHLTPLFHLFHFFLRIVLTIHTPREGVTFSSPGDGLLWLNLL